MATEKSNPDAPESMALPADRIQDIARTLSIEALGEIEDERGFPMFDRERWDALGDQLTDGFARVIGEAYRQSLQPTAATIARLHRGSRADDPELEAAA